MGSVINRGSRSRPNWYLRFKDLDGTWRWHPSRQPTKSAARQILHKIEARIAEGLVGVEKPKHDPRCKELMDPWAAGLHNRDAVNDRSRLRRHVLPVFGAKRLSQVDLAAVMSWLDEQRAAGQLSDATIRHNLNLLSRFFSWAIERGHTQVNPVRQIPTGKRPKQTAKKNIPWLSDDAVARQCFQKLPSPVNLMFFLGNRSGLRTGEISGLRMSDLGFLDEGVIRLRHSYDGPLKEDKHEGKVKWAPAAENCAEVLGAWLEQRLADDAGPEDLVFPGPKYPKRPCRALWIERKWNVVRDDLSLGLTWYQATRHSFTSRLLAAGASLDEVSAALGHSSPVVTRRYYDHFIRRSFSKVMRGALDVDDPEKEPHEDALPGEHHDAAPDSEPPEEND